MRNTILILLMILSFCEIDLAQSKLSNAQLQRFYNPPNYYSPLEAKQQYPDQKAPSRIVVEEFKVVDGDTIYKYVSWVEWHFENVSVEYDYAGPYEMDYKTTKVYWPRRKLLTLEEVVEPWGYKQDSCVEFFNPLGFKTSQRDYLILNFEIIESNIRNFVYKDDSLLQKVIFIDNGQITRIDSLSYSQGKLLRADIFSMPSGINRYSIFNYDSLNKSNFEYVEWHDPRQSASGFHLKNATNVEINLESEMTNEELLKQMQEKGLVKCKYRASNWTKEVSFYKPANSVNIVKFDKKGRRLGQVGWTIGHENTISGKIYNYFKVQN